MLIKTIIYFSEKNLNSLAATKFFYKMKIIMKRETGFRMFG